MNGEFYDYRYCSLRRSSIVRPQGRESALVTLAYITQNKTDLIQINFQNVLVMTPSWLSEYVQTLKEKGITSVEFLKSDNPSVNSSIEFILPEIN